MPSGAGTLDNVRMTGIARGLQTRAERVGFVLFGIGLVFLTVTVIPFFFGDHNRSLWLNIGCMLAPIGFVVIVVAAVRHGRQQQRDVLQQLERELH